MSSVIHRLLAVSFFLLFASSTLSAKETFTACGHPDYPPFNWYDGEQYHGVAVDVVNRIEEHLAIQIDIKYVGPWARCLKSIEAGDTDILLAAYATPERQQYTNFTETPLAKDRKAAFVWQGREFRFNSWQDLVGKRTAIQRGVSFGKEFDQFLNDNVVVFEVTERLQYFQMLKAGRIDFISTGEYLGLIHAKRAGFDGSVVSLPNSISVGYLYLGVSKKSDFMTLMPQMNRVINDVVKPDFISRSILKHMTSYLSGIEAEQP